MAKTRKQNQKQKLQKFPGVKTEVKEEEGSDYEVENVIKPEKVIKTENIKTETESEDSDDEEMEQDSDANEDGDNVVNENNENGLKQKKTKQSENKNAVKKTRYVLFIGNLPFSVTREEIMKHFKAIGNIIDVRLITDKNTKKSKGFGYIEFSNAESHIKALSLHHSVLLKRRINVFYTQGGKNKTEEKKKAIKSKNFKLQALRKAGKLPGSVKETQKRSVRRAKQRSTKTKDE